MLTYLIGPKSGPRHQFALHGADVGIGPTTCGWRADPSGHRRAGYWRHTAERRQATPTARSTRSAAGAVHAAPPSEPEPTSTAGQRWWSWASPTWGGMRPSRS